MLIDTHCHLFKDEYENLEELLFKLEEENIIVIINGYDKKSNIEALELANNYKNVYATIGYHPNEVDNILLEDFNILEEQLKSKKVVGVGEIGLDYYYTKENQEKQVDYFKKQLDMALKHNLPVIIHMRDSIEETYNILSHYNLKGIMHAYSGSIEMANRFIKLGFKLGIGGIITFKNSKLHEVIKEIPIEYILIETDSPYLTPEPHRGKKNNPLYLKYILKRISEVKNIPLKQLCTTIYNNTLEIFDLKFDK